MKNGYGDGEKRIIGSILAEYPEVSWLKYENKMIFMITVRVMIIINVEQTC